MNAHNLEAAITEAKRRAQTLGRDYRVILFVSGIGPAADGDAFQ